MSRRKEKASTARREFLKLAALATVSGAAVAATGAREARADETAQPRGSGYRETAHVKKVYALSRF